MWRWALWMPTAPSCEISLELSQRAQGCTQLSVIGATSVRSFTEHSKSPAIFVASACRLSAGLFGLARKCGEPSGPLRSLDIGVRVRPHSTVDGLRGSDAAFDALALRWSLFTTGIEKYARRQLGPAGLLPVSSRPCSCRRAMVRKCDDGRLAHQR